MSTIESYYERVDAGDKLVQVWLSKEELEGLDEIKKQKEVEVFKTLGAQVHIHRGTVIRCLLREAVKNATEED